MSAATRAALYHRVSTVDQNPQLARRELHAAAKRMGLRIALDIRETGKGTNNDRPGLMRVLGAAQLGDIDVVLVWKLDRFGRSAFDLLGNIRQLEVAGVRFVSVTQGIDIRPGGDPMSRLVLTLLSAIAEFERDLIVERTRLGLANARRAGKRLGRPRVPMPPADKVQRLKARGMTWLEIAERLGCTVWAARRAAGAVKIGGSKTRGRSRRHGRSRSEM
jgi:DNA invertase Pin-like site-specific DNA recombinase